MLSGSSSVTRQTADTAMLITGSTNLWSGRAYGNNTCNLGVASETYAISEFTFTHELGHMSGAHHNRENTNKKYFDYGYGKLFKMGPTIYTGHRTIMA